jgi:hypothetical protein
VWGSIWWTPTTNYGRVPGVAWVFRTVTRNSASKDHVVSGLIAKRAELAGAIDQLQRQLDQYRADLTHIDGVLRNLTTDLDAETIRPKRAYRKASVMTSSTFIKHPQANELLARTR